MTYGADAVSELIAESGWSYPVAVERLEREHGMANVQLDPKGNHYIMLVELTSEGDFNRFETEADLEEKLQPLIDGEIRSRQTGIVGWFKRTFLG